MYLLSEVRLSPHTYLQNFSYGTLVTKASSGSVVIILNWFEELKARVPTSQ